MIPEINSRVSVSVATSCGYLVWYSGDIACGYKKSRGILVNPSLPQFRYTVLSLLKFSPTASGVKHTLEQLKDTEIQRH